MHHIDIDSDTESGSVVSGGNQREVDRKRAQKRMAKHAKGPKRNQAAINKKKDTDAEIMRKKQE